MQQIVSSNLIILCIVISSTNDQLLSQGYFHSDNLTFVNQSQYIISQSNNSLQLTKPTQAEFKYDDGLIFTIEKQ